MELKREMMRRVVMPVGVKVYQWRGDPLARLMSPKVRRDPYPLYAEIRAKGTVRSRFDMWATARYEPVAQILKDPKWSSAPRHFKNYQPLPVIDGETRGSLPSDDALLLTMDPPDHTRIRRLVGGTFSPRAVAALEPWIRTRTDELVSRIDGRAGFDLIGDLAFPLPMAVICHMLGVPPGDEDRFREWGHHVAAGLDPTFDMDPNGPIVKAQLALTQYFRTLIEQRRTDPGDDLLSALIAAEAEGERLNAEELLATCFLILVAGFETTVNLIGNGSVALMDRPDAWQALRDDPGLIPGAIEELLRFDSPVQLTSRNATEDLEVDGVPIAKGNQVIVLLGGANRDPDIFPNPDRIDIQRPDAGRHLSFSTGLHHCLGAALARLEARIALEAMTARFERLTLAGRADRRPFMVLRGFERLPVQATAARAELGAQP